MSADDDLRIKPGHIRDRKAPRRARSFVAQALAATNKAGGFASGSRRSSTRGSNFGRGRAASLQAMARLPRRARLVTVKARVVRQGGRGAPLATHLGYLRRDGVTRDGAPGRLFDEAGDDADPRAFAERCDGDRHHFRFIVSPEDAGELADLRSYTRDLMATAERDLGTRLDWVAIDHWNTQHPHIHILVRGRADDGENLVISRDYIAGGFRARASDRATLELGARSDLEIRRSLEREIEAERWTGLDRALARSANDSVIDLRPEATRTGGDDQSVRIGRLRKLERLGLATPLGPAQWRLADGLEPRLRALGERGDVIKRLHRALAATGRDRGAETYVLSAEPERPVIGRLAARGLDDELKGTAYAVVDTTDGRVRHLTFPDLNAASDARPGAIVELRHFTDAKGQGRTALAVRSDLGLEAQVVATGATWLDRRLLDRETLALSRDGFGGEVQAALAARTDHLVAEKLARRQGQQVVFARDLLATLRQRELDGVGARLAAETGLAYRKPTDGDAVTGVYRRRLDLASGRFAMLDDGLGFALVPWKPSLERKIGRNVSGVMLPGGGEWSLGRKRGLSI
jgi:type IV secretory pathway VirD2 relaxase